MLVLLWPTQQDRNSSRLHDGIIKPFTFIQICCSKHQCDKAAPSRQSCSIKHFHFIKLYSVGSNVLDTNCTCNNIILT